MSVCTLCCSMSITKVSFTHFHTGPFILHYTRFRRIMGNMNSTTHTHTHTYALSLTHTHKHTLSLSLSLSLTHSLSITMSNLYRIYSCVCEMMIPQSSRTVRNAVLVRKSGFCGVCVCGGGVILFYFSVCFSITFPASTSIALRLYTAYLDSLLRVTTSFAGKLSRISIWNFGHD